MGALTSNRKRTDACFSLHSPFPLVNSSNDHYYCSNQIETHISKKPRISDCNSPVKVIVTPPRVNSRLRRYPEPDKFRREVHAPCRLKNRSGFLSSRVKLENSGEREKALEMGNTLKRGYEKAKDNLIGTFRHINVEKSKEIKVDKNEEVIDLDDEPEKGDEISKDLGKVEILEDGNVVRSVISDDYRVTSVDGSELEIEELGGKSVQNDDLEEFLAVSGLTKAEDAGKILGSRSLNREAYEELLSNVTKKYSHKRNSLDFEIKLHEAHRQSFQLPHKLKEKKPEELKKPDEDLLHEPFVPLTEEEERDVKRALSNSNRRRLLVTHENSNIEITGEILQCLRPGQWLNDEVINVYLELLKEREKREPKKFLNCHFFNTFFYKKLIGGRNGYDYKAVRRWTTQRKLGYGLTECDKIFVPIHKEVHWCLAVINKKDKSFQYLDSLGGKDGQVLRVLAQYFMDEAKDKSGHEIDVDAWEKDYVQDLPEQHNGFDCGVFMIKYADFYSRGLGLHFSQENMPYFRLRTAKEILRLKAD